MDGRELILSMNEMIKNAAPRLLVCFCIDGSLSMIEEQRIKIANEGVRSFIEDIKSREYAVDAVELCLVVFSGASASLVFPFQGLSNFTFEDIRPEGGTPMWEAVALGVTQIEERVAFFSRCGCKTYRPQLVVMSDGGASMQDVRDYKEKTQKKVHEMQRNGKLKVSCVAIGNQRNNLAEISVDGYVTPPEEFQSKQFFEWLSRSVSMASQAAPDEDIHMSYGTED